MAYSFSYREEMPMVNGVIPSADKDRKPEEKQSPRYYKESNNHGNAG